jgi:hypothetical protein
VPVQIKFKVGKKQKQDKLIGKLIASQLTSQIASQKELIRTAIQNVKAMSSSTKIQSDQHIEFG